MTVKQETVRKNVKLKPRVVEALGVAVAKDYPASGEGQITISTVINDLVEKHLIRAKGY